MIWLYVSCRMIFRWVIELRGKRAQEYVNYMWLYWGEGAWGPAANCAAYVCKYGVDYVDSYSLKLALAIVERQYDSFEETMAQSLS